MHRLGALGLRALFVFALFPAAAAAQRPTLSVTPGRETGARTAPGQIFTISFQLANPSPDSLHLAPELSLPDEWKAMAGGNPVSLGPRGGALWLVSVRVPNGAKAGPSRVPLRLRRKGGGEVLFEDTLELDVAERPRVQLRILASPSYAIAGDTVSVRFLVHNEGNAPADFRVQLRAHGGLAADQREFTLTLAPGASAERASLLRAAEVTQSQAAGVHVHAASIANSEVRDSASVEMVVVPTTRRADGLYHHVPARLRLRGGESGRGSVVSELTGGGQLLDGRGPSVAFQLRSRAGSDPLMQEPNLYALGIRGEHYDVQLGDQVFETGTLSGGGRSGFGAGASVSRGPISAGGFVSRQRGGVGGAGEQSAFATFRPGGHEIASRVTRTGATGSTPGGTLATLAYATSPFKGADLRLEYGRGRSEKGVGAGYSVAVHGDHGWGRYNVAHRAGDDALPGPLRGSQSTLASADVAAVRGVRFGGTVASYQQKSALALSYVSGGTAVGLHADFFGVAGAEYRKTESHVSLQGETLRMGEEALRIRTGTRVGPLALNAAAETGRRSDPVSRKAVGYTDLSATPSVALGGALVSMFARNVRGRAGDAVTEAGWSLGGSLSGELVRRLRVSLAGSDNAPRIVGGEREQRVEARLEQKLPGEHLVTLRAQHARGTALLGQASGLSLEYSMPLKLPTSKARTPGRVVGRVTDGEFGPGLAGVLVRLNDQMVVSDRAGYVVFSRVRGGVHALDVAGSRDGGRVAIGDSLVTVEEAGSSRPFHLRMVHGAHVRGTVRLVVSANGLIGSNQDPGGALENLVFLLESASDTIFLVTDPHGNFDAGRIRPGRWTVSHVGGALPALYAFEQSRIEFMVAAGEDRQIELVVRPKRRDIQMVASGEVLVTEREAPTEMQVTPVETEHGAITAVAVRAAPTRPERAPASQVRVSPPVVISYATYEAKAVPRVAASSAIHFADHSVNGRATASGRRVSNAYAPRAERTVTSRVALSAPFRSASDQRPLEQNTPIRSRREDEDDPPDRPPRSELLAALWDPRPRHERVPWDPLSSSGRAPPGSNLMQDPPPARAAPG